jgi:hypothetical protein
MSDDFFSGKWIGEYRYSNVHAGMEHKAPVKFEIEMTLEAGVLKGVCIDEETKGYFDKPTLIEGTIKDNDILFRKKYPFFWDHDDRNNPRFIPKLPAREVQYRGHFANGKFEGEWTVSSRFTDETDEVFEYSNAGTWSMQKVG